MWVAFVIVAGLVWGGQDSLSRAKELYSSAAYEDALKILDVLVKAPPAPAEVRDVAVYRVFCLLALDRDAEAVKGIAAIVRADPLFRPSETQASPRLRARFADVRTPLLPSIVKETFARARESLDRREFAAAIAGFDLVIALSKEIAPQNPDLASMSAGLRETARAAAAAEPPPPVPVAGRIYGPESKGITAPVVSAQVIPQLPRGISVGSDQPLEGVIELVIDQAGQVKSAKMRTSILAGYDEILVEAALKWRFRPALLGESPVLYRHSMVITLRH